MHFNVSKCVVLKNGSTQISLSPFFPKTVTNVKWFKRRPSEDYCISNLSYDLRSRHFSQSFAAVYDAELLQLGDLANAVACVVLLLATRNRPTTNLLSLFILLIYSLPCPSRYFFSIASHAQSSESTGSYLSFQYSSNLQFGYQVFQDAGVFIKRSFQALWRSFGLVNLISFLTQHQNQGWQNAMRFTAKCLKILLQ